MTRTQRQGVRRRFSRRDAVKAIYRRQRLVGLIFLLVAIAATFTLHRPANYRSEATLQLQPAAGTVEADWRRDMHAEIKLLRGYDLARRVVSELGADAFGARTEAEAVAMMRASLDSDIDITASTMSLTYRHADPEFVQRALDEVVHHYVVKHGETYRADGVVQALATQAEALRRVIDDLDTEADDLRRRAGAGEADGRLTDLTQRMGDLEQRRDHVGVARRSSEARVAVIRELLLDTPERLVMEEATGLVNPASDAIRKELAELRLREMDVRQNFEESSRVVQSLRERIAEAEALLGGEPQNRSELRTAYNELFGTLKIELAVEEAALASSTAELEQIDGQLVEVHESIRRLERSASRLLQIESERTVANEAFLACSSKLQEARIDAASDFDRGAVTVVQAPTASFVRPAPDVQTVIIVGLLLALFLGLVGGLVGGSFDTTVRSRDQAEELLAVPVLGTIEFDRRGIDPVPGERGCDLGHGVREMLVRAADQLASDDERHLVIGVVGATRGEGASSVAMNLAVQLSRQSWRRVLLLDADLRAPRVDTAFMCPREPGLTCYVTGLDTMIRPQRPGGDRLRILPIGYDYGEDTEPDCTRLDELIDDCRAEYDVTVVDLPPLTEGWGSTVGARCDGMVMVVASEGSHQEVVRHARREMDRLHAPCLGVILNKCKYRVPDWLYRRL